MHEKGAALATPCNGELWIEFPSRLRRPSLRVADSLKMPRLFRWRRLFGVGRTLGRIVRNQYSFCLFLARQTELQRPGWSGSVICVRKLEQESPSRCVCFHNLVGRIFIAAGDQFSVHISESVGANSGAGDSGTLHGHFQSEEGLAFVLAFPCSCELLQAGVVGGQLQRECGYSESRHTHQEDSQQPERASPCSIFVRFIENVHDAFLQSI